MQSLLRIIFKSLLYNRKTVIYQFLIIALLAAIITGSLLTGESVRESLRKSASGRLGNTGILISSGTRYADQELVKRISDLSTLKCTGILETYGSGQGFNSQKVAPNTHVFAVSKDFFVFQGNDTTDIHPGEVAINKRLADYLGIKKGEDIIIRYKALSDIPSDAPFAPSGDDTKSLVLKVGRILDASQNGNFSLSVSQITPMNVFLNKADLEELAGKASKINRILIKKSKTITAEEASDILKKTLKPQDIGIHLRKISKTGQIELVSDRIFIDSTILNEIRAIIPVAAPVLTYLGNKFTLGNASTPYSFISALPASLYPGIAKGNNIIINKWLASDLSAKKGDTIKISWYAPDSLNKLVVKGNNFIVHDITDITGIWSDSLLMPAFPGIAGKESCSDWDAGVTIKMNEIRPKDEDYWKRFRGTPKAFISYEKGKEIWGNNFSPATSIRFPAGITEDEIDEKLQGSIDPMKAGLIVTDISKESIKAADEGVDFGTLFLSLGFFLIVASFVLLSFATSSYFNSRRKHLRILFALGFRNRWIEKSLILETGIICFAGALLGSVAGYLVDIIITIALNSVWKGAVQTNTLEAYFNIPVVLTGLLLTFLFTMIFNVFKVKRYLSRLNKTTKNLTGKFPKFPHTLLLVVASALTVSLFTASLLDAEKRSAFSFASGTVLLITFILTARQYYTRRSVDGSLAGLSINNLSKSYFSMNPSNAVTPVLFIAAGIFSVFITGANKMDFNGSQMKRSGGTGGYTLWCESPIPVKEDLTSEIVRKSLGLYDSTFRNMSFVQMKRSSGNDASCLNLNHVTVPPLLGVDPTPFISKGSFSFSGSVKSGNIADPWSYLKISSKNNIIYGIADQTVLEWGLKMKIGDTLIMRTENGAPLKIILAAGLQSSVFQGNVLIGIQNFTHFFPSISGSSVLLVDGDFASSKVYKSALEDRFEKNGIDIQPTSDRLAAFYEVTNTYLSVFGVFGAFGMILGIAGLGFVLLKNYNNRKYEFALMLATGFRLKKIRAMILREQLVILFAGVFSGILSAIVATLPSLLNNQDIPWTLLSLMTLAIIVTGLLALSLSLRSVTRQSLVENLKRE